MRFVWKLINAKDPFGPVRRSSSFFLSNSICYDGLFKYIEYPSVCEINAIYELPSYLLTYSATDDPEWSRGALNKDCIILFHAGKEISLWELALVMYDGWVITWTRELVYSIRLYMRWYLLRPIDEIVDRRYTTSPCPPRPQARLLQMRRVIETPQIYLSP